MRDQDFLKWFAFFWTFCGMAYVAAITFFPVPSTGTKYADTVLGFIIGTAFSLTIKWAFDSNYVQNHKDADPPKDAPPSPLPTTETTP